MTSNREIRGILQEIDAGKVLYDEPMSLHTSLAVGGKADALVVVEHENQLARVIKKFRMEGINYFTAGNLTNVIVKDGGYRGAIILMTGMKEIQCEPVEGHEGYILAQTGASLSKVVSRSVVEALSGVEFCSGIPGSVGGAVWMNAGAYGREMKDVIESVTVLDTEGSKKTMIREAISFGYRTSSFPSGTIILGARFRLKKGDRATMKARISEILQWRQAKHPLEYPSAGSVFKNPPGHPAGKIIEDMGLKGEKAGGAEISSKHANFIVNKGGATAADVLALIRLVQSRAREEKNIDLETEVVVIGEDRC